MSEQLEGVVERITFHNKENGFCVLKVKVGKRQDVTTVIGNATAISVGEYIQCDGGWNQDAKFGVQFRSSNIKVSAPTSQEGILKYLSSGLIRGIGKHYAKRMIAEFGDQIFDVLDNHPEQLTRLTGFGEKRITGIQQSWQEQKVVRDIMVFLHANGIGSTRATRIYKTYGEHAIETITNNPYCLARDIYGIGFKSADELAQRLNIAKDSIVRVRAGLHFVIQECLSQGSCAVERENLIYKSQELLEVNEDVVSKALSEELDGGDLISDSLDEIELIYLAPFYHMEISVAKNVMRIQDGELPWGDIDVEQAVEWVQNETNLLLSSTQQDALALALTEKFMIVTGGPGVGKTTLVNSVLKIIKREHINIALCAPTGRAAKRMQETTGCEAKTVHRLLEYDPANRGFKYNDDNPLEVDFVIVDEASMIDLNLMYSLVQAIPDRAAVLFVGDIDQLPSVGAGSVLSDLILSDKIQTVKLTEIFRQAADSDIIMNAHRINKGEMPQARKSEDGVSDFYFVEANTPEEIMRKLIYMVTKRIPERFGFDPIDDIQVLTPMNRAGLGSRALNNCLQEVLNPNAANAISQFGWNFAVGDKVIQTVNNYDKVVFNGDIGCIRKILHEEKTMTILFDGKLVEYSFNELDELALAYAITIHKSQGSEYPVVVMPLATQHYNLLERNLVYTGVTRGKKLVIIVGQKKALSTAVNNSRASSRVTKLKERLIAEI